MHFAPDTEASLAFAVDLANTVAGATKSGLDELASPADLTALFTVHRFSGRLDEDEAESGGRAVHASSRLTGVSAVLRVG